MKEKRMEEKEESEKKIVKFNGRILRSRQLKRGLENTRPVKRLFTPEIKRHLKSWLVRRRDNPYPSRQEKIQLAAHTGLTYVQICNWFANWRRKLKNSGKNVNKLTWTTLIKSYNDQALGNVEHLSISSDDSIWQEPEMERSETHDNKINYKKNHSVDHCYTFAQNALKLSSSETQQIENPSNPDFFAQCFQISSTTDFIKEPTKSTDIKKKKNSKNKPRLRVRCSASKRKKSNRTWKCLGERRNENLLCSIGSDPLLLSKWKRSADLFQPKSYSRLDSFEKRSFTVSKPDETLHGREELDAAEALTFLSRASATGFFKTTFQMRD